MTTYHIHWVSMDGQNSIDCGTFESDRSHDAITTWGDPAIDAAQGMLLDQCADDEERQRIEWGHMTVDAVTA